MPEEKNYEAIRNTGVEKSDFKQSGEISKPIESQKYEEKEIQAKAVPEGTPSADPENRTEPIKRFPRRDRPFKSGANGGYEAKESQRHARYKKKICRFCLDKNAEVSYRDSAVLGNYITERGKILPRRITGTCAKHQRDLSRAIKRARILAVLPFSVK